MEMCTVQPKIIQIPAHLAAPSVSTLRLLIIFYASTPQHPPHPVHTLRAHTLRPHPHPPHPQHHSQLDQHPQHLSTLSTAFMHNVL